MAVVCFPPARLSAWYELPLTVRHFPSAAQSLLLVIPFEVLSLPLDGLSNTACLSKLM